MAASIVVADDHLVLREGIRAVFDAEPDINVVAEAADGLEALNLVNELDPDLLLIDLSMPGLPGLEVIRRVTTGAHETKVIVLTMHADEVAGRSDPLRHQQRDRSPRALAGWTFLGRLAGQPRDSRCERGQLCSRRWRWVRY